LFDIVLSNDIKSDKVTPILNIMRKKHKLTLKRINATPTLANIKWKDIESLLRALGAKITEGEGSRVRVLLNNERAIFHEPHPEKESRKGSVEDIRKFLQNAGVKNDNDS